MLHGLNHLTLATGDLDRSVAFYVDLLGCRPRVRWARGAYLTLGDLWLCLSCDPPQPARDYSHVAFGISPEQFSAFCARLRAAEVAATTAAEDARRAEALFSRGLIARQDLDHAQAQARSTAAQQDAAKQALAEAELRVAYTTLRAPEAGRVTRKTVEEGQFVQPGQALLALVTDDLWVVANFKETQLADIRPGLAVQIKVDAYPRKVFRGHVDSIQAGTGSRFSLLPPENATGNYVKVVQRVPVKIVFDEPPDPERPLGPGMSVVPTVYTRE